MTKTAKSKRVVVLRQYVNNKIKETPVDIVAFLVRPAWQDTNRYGENVYDRGGVVAVIIAGDRYLSVGIDNLRVREANDD